MYEVASPSNASEFRFSVSRRGTALKLLSFFAEPPCSNGRSTEALLLAADRPWRLPIAGDGSFSGMYVVSPALLNAFVTTEEYSLSGRFARRGKSARVVFRVRQVGEGGTVCDTGDRHATARRWCHS